VPYDGRKDVTQQMIAHELVGHNIFGLDDTYDPDVGVFDPSSIMGGGRDWTKRDISDIKGNFGMTLDEIGKDAG
jgi:hypothetical protein